jgi:molybdopterin molybdotransferase
LLSVTDARKLIIKNFKPLESEQIFLGDAAGRVISEPIKSGIDLPLFPNSSMDGYALRSIDIQDASVDKPVELLVVDDIPAGKISSVEISMGQTSRIMTGAPMPDGADAVVPIEDTDQYQQGTQSKPLTANIKVFRSLQSGDYVRQKGEDVRSGEEVIPSGQRIRPQEVGLLAMLGIQSVPAFKKPRVAVVSTGDELIPIDVPLEPGKIHDSNTYTLSAQIIRDGGEFLNLGIAADNESAVIEVLEEAVLMNANLIISTAGVSVGAFDFVKSVVSRFGRIEFWRVNMRPGKPLTFGHYRKIPFIGLPGNPVSAYVGYEIFVRPAIYRLSGMKVVDQPVVQVRLQEPIESDGRESYLRAFIKHEGGKWFAKLTGHQGSGNLRSLVQANALLVIPSGVKSLPSGSMVDAIFLDYYI